MISIGILYLEAMVRVISAILMGGMILAMLVVHTSAIILTEMMTVYLIYLIIVQKIIILCRKTLMEME